MANITLVDSSSVDVWQLWSTLTAENQQHLDENALLA